MKTLLSTVLLLLSFSLSAAVPLRWTVETSRLQPAQFEAFHGETLELAATMQSYGKPLAITNDLIGIYWQTNGMGSAYWAAPAVLSNNVMTARWTPSMDVGANVYSCFIGAPGEIYRAAFQLRLRPSPGAAPSELPLPVKTLDFAQVTVLNAPYYSKSETDAKIIELAPAPSNYATVSNRAMTAVQPTAISDMETQTHAAATYQPKGSYLTSETDPTVYPWAKATSKPSYTWTEIGSKPTTFTPSAHSHATDSWFAEALSGKLDQTGASDLRLNGGASIYFDGEEWLTRVDSMVSQYAWDWSSIYNTPTTLAGYGIEDASISGNTITLGSHSATIPTALKCPAALTIQLNGTTAATYDGSAARTVNITTGGAPGATVASAALEYHADGQAISVSVAAAGTLTAVVDNWTDGQSQMAFVTLAAGASIAPAIKLIGYSEWPIGEEFMAVCTKRGSKIYVNPVCVTEE